MVQKMIPENDPKTDNKGPKKRSQKMLQKRTQNGDQPPKNALKGIDEWVTKWPKVAQPLLLGTNTGCTLRAPPTFRTFGTGVGGNGAFLGMDFFAFS